VTNIKEIKRQPNEEGIASFSHYVKRCEEGSISDFVVVAAGHDPAGEPSYSFNTNMEDGWRLLAALEYAKAGIMDTLLRNSTTEEIK